jgi:hypothetical protein
MTVPLNLNNLYKIGGTKWDMFTSIHIKKLGSIISEVIMAIKKIIRVLVYYGCISDAMCNGSYWS